jgi:hypothetical protein
MEIFKKKYDGDSLCDVSRDVSEAFDEDFNENASVVPKDKHGFHTGTFTITIEWEDSE